MKRLFKRILGIIFFAAFIFGIVYALNIKFSFNLPFYIPSVQNEKILIIACLVLSLIFLFASIILFMQSKKRKKIKNEAPVINNNENIDGEETKMVSPQPMKIKSYGRKRRCKGFIPLLIHLAIFILIAYLLYRFVGADKINELALRITDLLVNNLKITLIAAGMFALLSFLYINKFKKLDYLIDFNFYFLTNKVNHPNMVPHYFCPINTNNPLIYNRLNIKKAKYREICASFFMICKTLISSFILLLLVVPTFGPYICNDSSFLLFNLTKKAYLVLLVALLIPNIDILLFAIFNLIPIFDIFCYRTKCDSDGITRRPVKISGHFFAKLFDVIYYITVYSIFPCVTFSYSYSRLKNTKTMIKYFKANEIADNIYDVFKK